MKLGKVEVKIDRPDAVDRAWKVLDVLIDGVVVMSLNKDGGIVMFKDKLDMTKEKEDKDIWYFDLKKEKAVEE